MVGASARTPCSRAWCGAFVHTSDLITTRLLGSLAIRAAALVTVEPDTVVVVAHDRGNAFATNAIDDFVGKRRVTDEIAEAIHRVDRLRW